ncbi:MAG: hypothetical protein QW275_02450 [Candidatus Anstonellaceae archaeon]
MVSASKGKKTVAKKEEKKHTFWNDWVLHHPEDWVLMVLAAVGFANLLPPINTLLGQNLNYAWPIIVLVIGIKKLMDRWS